MLARHEPLCNLDFAKLASTNVPSLITKFFLPLINLSTTGYFKERFIMSRWIAVISPTDIKDDNKDNPPTIAVPRTAPMRIFIIKSKGENWPNKREALTLNKHNVNSVTIIVRKYS